MKRMPLTLQGAERLRGELKRLKTEDRPRIIQAIAEARAHGDLSENAEYHAAREQTSRLRHLPRPPAARPRERREDGEDEVRPPRRQPSGAGPRERPRVHHQPESRLRGRRDHAGANVRVTHRSLFDGSLQGIARTDRPAFSFQGHPEASPGPHDLRAAVRPLHRADHTLKRLQRAERCRGGQLAQKRRRRLRSDADVMPKRTDIQSILIIGAGPIVIGQACEFDYSGAQACKALKEEGYRVILVNSNPATIMTDPEMADAIYIEPVNWRTVERIIEKERPDALLPTMGGQTALNSALDLVREGVLEKYGVELIAASREAIDMAEDRELFRNAMREIGLESPRSRIAHSMEEALAVQAEIGFPTVIRPSFTLGGIGRRHRLQPRGVRRDRRARPRCLADQRSAARRVGARLERIRDGGGARPQRQLHHRLLDREPRSDGRAHRRLDHRRAGADAHRQGISAHARRLDRGAAQDRRRVRRLERAVRAQPDRRAPARHRDEPARVALLGARLEGDRLPDREDRREARGRLHARRAARTTSPAARRRRRSSRRSTTSSPRSRASRSRNSRAPTIA